MAKSIVSAVAKKMVEINSRLGTIGDGSVQLCIRSVGTDAVQLRKFKYQPDLGTPKTTKMAQFENYDKLYDYIVVFNDALKFAGIKLG